jgi:murein DD-endopeptidase MepM/ murein hydrolase activator NlpD
MATVPTATSSAAPPTQEAEAAAEKKGAEKAEPPKPPKGGADPSDLAKARRDAAKSKSALAKDKKQKAKAAESLQAAEEEFGAAQEAAEAALAELQAANEAQAAAQSAALGLRGVVSIEPTVLPPAPTPEQAETASALEQSAQARVEAAMAAGEEALSALTSAEQELATAEEALAAKAEEVAASKAEYADSKEKVEVYRESLAKTRQVPVAKGSYRLTARFGQRGGYWSGGIHTGLDFAGSVGTDVRAAASGKVVSAGWEGAYGNQIVIDHGNGYQTMYSHLSRMNVSVGQKVTAGDHIGDMGSTGNSTGSHLHFEVTKGGKFIDPEGWLGW